MDQETALETRAFNQRTAPAVGQQKLNRQKCTLRSRAQYALPALLMFILALFSSSAFADDTDRVLEKSGIAYPGGWDMNTVGEVRGNAGAPVVQDNKPVTFKLSAQKDSYTVIASPGWYWKESGFIIADGSAVAVRGSKSLGKDSSLYVIAQDINNESTGKKLRLRSADGKPLWSGASNLSGQGGKNSPTKRGPLKGASQGGRQKHGR